MDSLDNSIVDDINLEDDMLDDSIEDEVIFQDKIEDDNGNGKPTNEVVPVSTNGEEQQPIDPMQARLRQIEEEARKIRELQNEFHATNHSMSSTTSQPLPHLTAEEKAELDARSVYVGNVEYAATPEQLEEHFRGCGPIERVTIMSDKFSGHPKGFAYIQFTETEGMQNALALDESLFLGRQIKVSMKRTNKPGLSSTNRPPRGRGIRGRFQRGFGGFRGMRGRPIRRRGFAPY